MAELASPLAGGIQAVRRSVPSSVFAPPAAPAPAQPDPVTTNLISQNSLALGGVSQQLANISSRVNQLSMSLSAIQNSLASNAALERQREQANQNREAILAEQGLREGKEGQIEQKIQNSLFAPIQKITTKTRGLLSRLSSFLFVIGGAWLLDKVVLTIQALSTKNTDLLKSVISNVTKNVLIIGGLLLLTRGKIGSIKGTLMALRTGVLRVTAAGLILAPFESIKKLLIRVWNFIADTPLFPGMKPIALPDEKKETEGTWTDVNDLETTDTPQLWAEREDPADGVVKPMNYNKETDTWTPREVTNDSSSDDNTQQLKDDGVIPEDYTPPEKTNEGNKLLNFFFGKPEAIDSKENKSNNTTNVESDSNTTTSENVTPTEEDSSGGIPGAGQWVENVPEGYKIDLDSKTVVPINKNKENNVSQKISVSDEDLDNNKLISSMVNSSGNTNEGVPQSPSGTSKSGDKQTPVINSSNNANNYVYNSYKNYQVVPV